MSGVGTKDTTKFKPTSGNNGKQVSNQNQNEPKKNSQGKRDSKSGADGRSGSQRNENVWTARAVLNAKQDPKTETQNTTEELTQKMASDLNLKDEKGEQQQNHDQRQNRKPSKYSSNMNQKGYKNSKRGNTHQEDSSKNQPVTQYVQKQTSSNEESKVVEPEEQIDETIDPNDRSDSPNNTAQKGGKVKKLSLAEFHSAVGGEDDAENETPSRILWVGNIGPDVSEEELTQEFSQFGKLESLRILHDRFCAFVNFEEESCAQKAKSVLQGTIIGSQYIVINYRKVDSLRPNPGSTTPDNAPLVLNAPSRALWIGNISDKVSEEDLYREFSKFGQIESVRLLTHKTCAFVNFMVVEDATKALYALQSKDIGGMPIKINFGKPPKRPNEMYSPFMMPPPGPYLPQPFYPPEYQYPMHYPPFQAPMPPFVPMEMSPQYQTMYIPNPMCDLCGANVKDTVNTPCGHPYCCNECITKYRTSAPDKLSKCPYCGTDIEKFMPFSIYPYAPYFPQMMPEFPQ